MVADTAKATLIAQGDGEGRLGGLTPPPAPAFSFLLKLQLRKHLHLALKRKRYVGAMWSCVFYGAFCAAMYYVFKNSFKDSQPWVGKLIATTLYPLFITLAINGAFQSAYVELLTEKESKMKIVQNVYGLTDAQYWGSWLLYYMLLSLPCIAILLLCTCVIAPIFRGANFVVVILVMLLAFLQQFLVVAVGSVFFNTLRGAQQVMGLFSVLLIEGASAAMIWVQGQGLAIQALFGLVPIMNVIQSLNALCWAAAGYTCHGSGAERQCHEGVGFSNLFTGQTCLVPYDVIEGKTLEESCLEQGPGGQYGVYKQFVPPGVCLLFMIVATIVFLFFTWWLDNVWQGEYGTAKPMCFCVNPAYVCPRRRQMPDSDPEQAVGAALSIQELRKEFPGGKVAVDNLSLSMRGGEIFAMLGHNGAGKTTAINCVVGLISPTSGGAIVNGHNIKTDIDGARRQLSICPQDNPMYEEYTVRQHLVYFSGLRGVAESRVNERVATILSALGLSEKIDDLCKALSGGQKRRLWVATALIGDSPIAFLDEPTSGMDPASRRELWDLLIARKASGCCVIFTTHYLEEADLLADRKCVLARGAVQAVGTSRELKHQFGVGYHLVVEMTGAVQPLPLERLVTSHIATAEKESLAAEEQAQAHDQAALSTERFTIPYADMDRCGALLLELEDQRNALGVRDYTLETTSLEEVFMVLGQKAEEGRSEGLAANEDFGEVDREAPAMEGHRQETTAKQVVMALLKMKLAVFRGSRGATFWSFVFPSLFIVLAFTLSNTDPSDPSSQSYAICLYPSLAFGFGSLGGCLSVIRSKEKKTKYVMIAQGIRVRDYWIGTVLSELAQLYVMVIVFLIMYSVQRPPGVGGGPTLLIVLTAIVAPVNNLLFSFNFATLFQSVEIAVKILPLLFMVMGMIPCAVVWILIQFVGGSTANLVANLVHVVFSLICPVYSLGGALVYVSQKYTGQDALSTAESFSSWAAIPLYLSPLVFLLFCGSLIHTDRKSYATPSGEYRDFGDVQKDDDVLAEEQRIEQTPQTEHGEAARYQKLSHTYRTKVDGQWKNTHAVRGISLGVQQGECFGLLGPNGAGKTTTLGVLTGDIRPPTAGHVSVFGQNMSSGAGMEEAFKLLGVCPQVDPIIDELSGRDHLLFFGRVKGVPEASLTVTVDNLLRRLGLNVFDAEKKAGKYSGGMKRKLSVGIALIGHSRMLFLDEPSAAVDAGAKRHLWKVIKNRASDQTVVLTTHSMEEAEALCDRLAIQVKGQLRCLGTPMHIRNKYGFGYQLELFVSGQDGGLSRQGSRSFKDAAGCSPSLQVLSFMSTQISPDAVLLEFHAERYLFRLPPLSRDCSLGKILSAITASKESIGIEDWSIERPTLEQVFLRFAKEQEDQLHE